MRMFESAGWEELVKWRGALCKAGLNSCWVLSAMLQCWGGQSVLVWAHACCIPLAQRLCAVALPFPAAAAPVNSTAAAKPLLTLPPRCPPPKLTQLVQADRADMWAEVVNGNGSGGLDRYKATCQVYGDCVAKLVGGQRRICRAGPSVGRGACSPCFCGAVRRHPSGLVVKLNNACA